MQETLNILMWSGNITDTKADRNAKKMSCVICHMLLAGTDSSQIESVLKTGLFLIYESRYESFSWALGESNMSSLRDQGKKIFERFTRNCIKNNKFTKWLVRTDPAEGRTTRLAKPRFMPVPFRNASYARSAIPQMVKLANRLGL